MTLSLPMLLLLLACGLGLYLYGIALVWRRDRLTAVFALLLPPLGLFALAKYWGERANNPRWYLLGGLVLLALAGGLFGWHVLATQQREEADWLRSHDADEARRVASARARRARALTSLVRSQGKVEIAGAATGITVPQHFRFIDRSELERAFAGTSDAPAADTIGWFVHERVDLTAANAWYVRVTWRGDGYVAARGLASVDTATLLAAMRRLRQPDPTATQEQEQTPQAHGFADLPTFDPQTARATWVVALARPRSEEQVLECQAVQLGRKGLVLFTIENMAAARAELCLRSVRLLAANVYFGVGQSHAEHSRMLDRNAPYGLAELITGEYVDKLRQAQARP